MTTTNIETVSISLMTKDIDTIATYIPISHPGTFMICALTEKAELSMRACATELASWVKETGANVAVAYSQFARHCEEVENGEFNWE